MFPGFSPFLVDWNRSNPSFFDYSRQLGSLSDYMVNIYCDQDPGLKSLFSTLVLMGILNEEDAQCFRVRSDVEGAFFFLVSAALLLAFVNTFVKRASSQYLRDVDARDAPVLHTHEKEHEIEVDDAKALITPVPVLFTDRFRWFLVRDDSPSKYLGVFSSSSLDDSMENDEDHTGASSAKDRSAEHGTAPLSPSSSRDPADEIAQVESASESFGVFRSSSVDSGEVYTNTDDD